MKFSSFLFFLFTGILPLRSQVRDRIRIDASATAGQILAPLRYLASDHLKGRYIALPEIDTAACYIADQFRKAGAKPVSGATGYYQVFDYLFEPYDKRRMDRQAAAHIPWSSGRPVRLKNVLAFVPGKDSTLRSQYIVLSSHYDHEGVQDIPMTVDGKLDSIFNGARDNATGTAAVIDAARYFARHPPGRSVLFICYTAEEEGEIGSEYYAEHPLVPLDHTVYNLNVDNAGYDTTTAICLFGLGRTSTDSLVSKACAAYGLAVLPEPPDQQFFNRSDNYSLAKKGIPAPTYSLGMTDWDAAAWKYYHQLNDEVSNMDLVYTVKFIRAFILAALYIANDPAQPRWADGDEYEATWKNLFHH